MSQEPSIVNYLKLILVSVYFVIISSSTILTLLIFYCPSHLAQIFIFIGLILIIFLGGSVCSQLSALIRDLKNDEKDL